MITKEKLQNHVNHLKGKHQHLHKMVEAAEAENAPSDYIKGLKKDKLQLKDEIAFNIKRIEKM